MLRVSGLPPARQDKERKAKDQSEEAHAESRFRRGPPLLHVAEQSRVEDALADDLAFGHVCEFSDHFADKEFQILEELFVVFTFHRPKVVVNNAIVVLGSKRLPRRGDD